MHTPAPCECGKPHSAPFVDWWKNYKFNPYREEAFVRCNACQRVGPGASTETEAITLWARSGTD